MVQILCIINTNGVPLLTRAIGVPPPSFPSLGLLSALATSTAQQGFPVRVVRCHDAQIAFRIYGGETLLVLASSVHGVTERQLLLSLDLLYDSLVFLIGEQELSQTRHVERLKKHLRAVSELLDFLLAEGSSIGPLVNAVEVTLSNETDSLHQVVQQFSDTIDTSYVCIFVGGRLCVATQEWWELSPTELVLTSAYLQSLPDASMRDIPVFLPNTNPTVPYRLVTIQIMTGVQVVMLLGPDPTINRVAELVVSLWPRDRSTLLESCLDPTNDALPSSVGLDSNILSFCIVDRRHNRFSLCLDPTRSTFSAGTSVEDRTQRYRILVAFYRSMTSQFTERANLSSTRAEHVPTDAYIQAKGYGLCALHRSYYEFYVMMAGSLPSYAMFSVAEVALRSLVQLMA